MLATGSKLHERYTIEAVLGIGGMGAVYRARADELGQQLVAIKEMMVRSDDGGDLLWAVTRFHKEAHLLASLRHPGLATVLDFFEAYGNYYLVMSFIDGRTLEEVAAEGRLPVWQVSDWVEQTCDVLEYLHAQSPPVVLRDLKPSNLMLDRWGKIWVIDFGIARCFDPSSRTTTLSRGIGTPGYAAVEQFTGNTDPRTDIYALGATAYHLLTGTVPPMSVSLLAGEVEMAPPRSKNPAVSVELEVVLLKMMALQKERRFHSIEAVRAAWRAAYQTDSGGEVPLATGNTTVACGTPTLVRRKCDRCGSMLVPLSSTCLQCEQPVEPPYEAPLPPPTMPPVVAPKRSTFSRLRDALLRILSR